LTGAGGSAGAASESAGAVPASGASWAWASSIWAATSASSESACILRGRGRFGRKTHPLSSNLVIGWGNPGF
jgi:hypothetical protein